MTQDAGTLLATWGRHTPSLLQAHLAEGFGRVADLPPECLQTSKYAVSLHTLLLLQGLLLLLLLLLLRLRRLRVRGLRGPLRRTS